MNFTSLFLQNLSISSAAYSKRGEIYARIHDMDTAGVILLRL